MKSATRLFTTVMLLALVLSLFSGRAQAQEANDKTLSPYFFVNSDDPDTDRLPLKATSVEVNIAGVIADVTVAQVYRNEGKNALEAIYVFPASTRAAVYAMKMTIGERTITAAIAKRDEARQEYEKARQEGKSSSLLEQQRPNVFQMNVANIMPGDTIKVEMRYTELLVPTNKEYEFVYPTVVGPRYSNHPSATAPASEHWIENPYLHQGQPPASDFKIDVHIAAGMPIRRITSTSHKVDIRYTGNSEAAVSLEQSESFSGNRDYILKYRLAGDGIESGLILSMGEKENFFLLMVQPPNRVTQEQIPGREYLFIVDVSGSMHGYPLDITKRLMKDLIGNLRQTDTFNVLLFAGGNSVLSEHSLPATPGNIAKAVSLIEQQRGGGGTELLPALKRALSLPRDENYSRTVVIATDGYVSVEPEAFDLIRSNLGNANLFAFGIGTSVNRHLIEGMARVGMGEPFVITKPDEAASKAEAFRTLIQSPLLTRINVDFDGFDAYDVEPPKVPDVLADRPVIVFGKWRGKPQGTITVKGISGQGAYRDMVAVPSVKPSQENSALRCLWARHRIALLADYNLLRPDDKRIEQVTELGLTYNLLTNHTSFVAVDTAVRNKGGKTATVSQPLPLPQGVSDYAVGGYAAPGASRSLMYSQQKMMLTENAADAAISTAPEPLKEKVQQPAWRISSVTASGGLSSNTVRKRVELDLKKLTKCLSAASTKITIKLTIDAKGMVKTIAVLGAGDKTIKDCVQKIAQTWRFGRNAGTKATNAEITFQPVP